MSLFDLFPRKNSKKYVSVWVSKEKVVFNSRMGRFYYDKRGRIDFIMPQTLLFLVVMDKQGTRLYYQNQDYDFRNMANFYHLKDVGV